MPRGRRRAHFSPSPLPNEMSGGVMVVGGGGGFKRSLPLLSPSIRWPRGAGLAWRAHTLTVSSATPAARFLTLTRQVGNSALGGGDKRAERLTKVARHRKALIIPPGDMEIERIFSFLFFYPPLETIWSSAVNTKRILGTARWERK